MLHAVGESVKRDIVSLTFRKGSANCRIEFYQSRNGQSSRLLNKSKGLRLHNNMSKVVYRRDVLNAAYPVGTEIQMTSSCDLEIVKISRKVKMKLRKDLPKCAATIRIDSDDLNYYYSDY